MGIVGILVTIGAGLFFYRLRCRHQFRYGLLEVAVSLVVIFLTFYPAGPYVFLTAEEYSWSGALLSKSVGMLAGMYIMVRGLDNIEKGELPAPWRSWWYRLFKVSISRMGNRLFGGDREIDPAGRD